MPRDSSGNYTLPAGNPVITGSIIASSWANNTLNDFATEMTDSLSRSGKGGMSSVFKVVDGIVSAPGLAFQNEPGSGLYRIGAADWALSVTGTNVLELKTGGIYAHQPFSAAAGVTSVTIAGNGTGSVPDFLINVNASNDIGFRMAAASGQGLAQSYVDGKSAQEWWFAVSNVATGVFSFKDVTSGKTIWQVAPSTDAITFSSQVLINGQANAYSEIITANATSGQSFGVAINGGTTAADNAFLVANQANSINFFQVRGDGVVFLNDAAAAPALWKAGFRGSPPNNQSSNYTLVVADAGKSVVFTAAATLTLPQSIFSQGDMTVVVAQGGVVTVTAGTGVTLTWANASNTTGNRTLTNIGIATIWWESATQAYITGSGLT